MRRRLCLSLLLAMLAPASALACNCGGVDVAKRVTAEFPDAAVVVTGSVQQLRIYEWVRSGQPGFSPRIKPVEVTIVVQKRWKGPATATVVVGTSSLGQGDCGMFFLLGGDYLVAARRLRAPLMDCTLPITGMCGLTQSLDYGTHLNLDGLLPPPVEPTSPPERPPEPGYPSAGAPPDPKDVGEILQAALGAHDLKWYVGRGVTRIVENAFSVGITGGKPDNQRVGSLIVVSGDKLPMGSVYVEVEDIRVSDTHAGVRFRISAWKNPMKKDAPAVPVMGESVLERDPQGWRLRVVTLSLVPLADLPRRAR